MYSIKQTVNLLITILIFLLSEQIEFVKSDCTTWNLFLQTKTIKCNSGSPECCGWIKTTCCTKIEKDNTEELNLICRIVVFVIVIGIILIFFAFLIGWIYSCYLIAKQIQQTPEDGETSTAFSVPVSDKPPSYSSLFVKPNPNPTNSQLNTNQSLSPNYAPYPYQQSTIPTISRLSSTTASTNSAYIIDNLDELPPYPDALSKSTC